MLYIHLSNIKISQLRIIPINNNQNVNNLIKKAKFELELRCALILKVRAMRQTFRSRAK